MQTGLDALGDHPGAIAEGRWRRVALDPTGKQEPHAIGPPEVEILADERLEKVPALHRAFKHIGETHLELRDGEAMIVAGGAVRGRHRPRQLLRPAIEEGLDIRRAQRVAGGLQGRRIRTREEAVVEALKPDALAAQTLLHPLVPVQTQLDGIRDVGADLEKAGTPVSSVDVEVEI